MDQRVSHKSKPSGSTSSHYQDMNIISTIEKTAIKTIITYTTFLHIQLIT